MAQELNPDVHHGLAALEEAIALCGSRAELARRVSQLTPCTAARIEQWIRRGVGAPPAFAPFIAHAVDDRVSVLRLCPEFAHGWALLRRQLNIAHRERKRSGTEPDIA